MSEFKSPSDTLRPGDFQTFLAYALLYLAQNEPLLPSNRLNLIVIAPHLTEPYRNELNVRGVTYIAEETGIWRLTGGVLGHQMWLLETSELAARNHPLMTIFSPLLLTETTRVTQDLREDGFESLVVFITQQISQFRLKGEAFAMQHLGSTTEMERLYDSLFKSLTKEEKRTLVRQLTPSERMEGLSPEQVAEGLSPEGREQLLHFLQQEPPKKSKRGKKP